MILTIIRKKTISTGKLGPAAFMIVCVCNRLNETKVREAIACGARCPERVYAHHGVKKVCGTCQDKIVALVRDETESREMEAA